MASEQDLCRDCLQLKPEVASLFDLIKILFYSDLKERAFLYTLEPERTLQSFRHRWIIFISLLVQKLLICLKKPMASAGYALELWLNLVSVNGGFKNLILHILQGKVIKPDDKSSPKFRSILGNLDTRVELDRSIGNGDANYYANLSIMAAKLAYEYEPFARTVVNDVWKMEFLGLSNFWNDYQNQFSTQAIAFRDKTVDADLIVVAFRGTEPFDADQWRTDIDISWFDLQGIGKIHSGFLKALGLQKGKGWPKEIPQGQDKPPFAYYTIREQLRNMLATNGRAKFVVTGHSLGGALAILFVAVLMLHEEEVLLEKMYGVYTYGQPRVGDAQFGKFMKERLRKYDVKYFRYVYSNDLVPRLPYDDKTLFFKHFAPCLYFNSCYKGNVLDEEPNKNYFSPMWFISKHLNAIWELIRSFILPHTKGPEYKEGWFLRIVRAVGLVIPGISEHATQDYVNLTRLGSFSSHHNCSDHLNQQDLELINWKK